MVFDASQAIPLNTLRPAKVIELNLMHPEILPTSETQWTLKNDHLIGTSPKATSQPLRWIAGFNPFATYELYDYSKGPVETTNIADSAPKVLAKLKKILATHPAPAP